jgi:outer membrane immunogenic protein
MKFAAICASALLFSTATAISADLPSRLAPPAWEPPAMISVPFWTGFYAGVNAGGALNLNQGAAYAPVTGGTGFDTLATTFADPGKSQSALTGGAQLGYNKQYGALVVGVEADLNYVNRASANASATFDPTGYYAAAPYTYTGYDVTGRRKAEWFGTLRGRVGVATGRALFYATGGLAYGQVGGGGTLATTGAVETYAPTGTKGERFGFALGAGIEYALTEAWSLKGEYLHVQFKDTSYLLTQATDANFQLAVRQKNSLDLVRVGVNYRF